MPTNPTRDEAVRRFDPGFWDKPTMMEVAAGGYVLHSDYDALRSEVSRLREDADRYAWIKARSLNKSVMDSKHQNGPFIAVGSILSGWSTPNDIDGAIDAAHAKDPTP